MLNLAALIEDPARNRPNEEAVVAGSTRLTYADLDARASQVAHLLRTRGVQAGDKVALSCPNLEWFPIVYYGILKAGAVVVPLNITLRAREVAYHLSDSDAKVYVCFEGTEQLDSGAQGIAGYAEAPDCTSFLLIPGAVETPLRGRDDVALLPVVLADQPTSFESVPTEADDTAVILYTSGTTGQPKGAELTHLNLTFNAMVVNREYGGAPGEDTHLIALPLFHSFGQTTQMNAAFAAGGKVVLVPRFSPAEVLRLIEAESVTHYSGVPTMYWAIMNHVRDLGAAIDVSKVSATLKWATSAAASMPVELLRSVEESLGVTLLEGYGLSETSPAVTFTPGRGPRRPGSIGRPLWGVQMKLVDADGEEIDTDADPTAVGEILIKGHPIMKGYYNRPEATAEVLRDGWLRTGDLARRDAEGFYFVVDRLKELIIRAGFNVYPREIEEVLMTHPAVSLAAVIGVPHPSHGEEVKAIIVKSSGDTTSEAELIAWAKDNMAPYKYPRVVQFVPSLPLNATGKIMKRQLT